MFGMFHRVASKPGRLPAVVGQPQKVACAQDINLQEQLVRYCVEGNLDKFKSLYQSRVNDVRLDGYVDDSEIDYPYLTFSMSQDGVVSNRLVHKRPTLLHYACGWCQPEMVNYLVEREVRLDTQDDGGETPLFVACSQESNGFDTDKVTDIVNILLGWEAGLRLVRSSDYWSPLHAAAWVGATEVMKAITVYRAGKPKRPRSLTRIRTLELKTRRGQTALHLACQRGHYETVRVLLTPSTVGDEFRSISGSDAHAKDQDGLTPFHVVCREGHEDIFDLFLKKNFRVNKYTQEGKPTPLHCAARSGHIRLVRRLLVEDIKAAESLDDTGYYPGMLASVCRNSEVSKLLGRAQLLVGNGPQSQIEAFLNECTSDNQIEQEAAGLNSKPQHQPLDVLEMNMELKEIKGCADGFSLGFKDYFIAILTGLTAGCETQELVKSGKISYNGSKRQFLSDWTTKFTAHRVIEAAGTAGGLALAAVGATTVISVGLNVVTMGAALPFLVVAMSAAAGGLKDILSAAVDSYSKEELLSGLGRMLKLGNNSDERLWVASTVAYALTQAKRARMSLRGNAQKRAALPAKEMIIILARAIINDDVLGRASTKEEKASALVEASLELTKDKVKLLLPQVDEVKEAFYKALAERLGFTGLEGAFEAFKVEQSQLVENLWQQFDSNNPDGLAGQLTKGFEDAHAKLLKDLDNVVKRLKGNKFPDEVSKRVIEAERRIKQLSRDKTKDLQSLMRQIQELQALQYHLLSIELTSNAVDLPTVIFSSQRMVNDVLVYNRSIRELSERSSDWIALNQQKYRNETTPILDPNAVAYESLDLDAAGFKKMLETFIDVLDAISNKFECLLERTLVLPGTSDSSDSFRQLVLEIARVRFKLERRPATPKRFGALNRFLMALDTDKEPQDWLEIVGVAATLVDEELTTLFFNLDDVLHQLLADVSHAPTAVSAETNEVEEETLSENDEREEEEEQITDTSCVPCV